ncbi:helix-turn-helix domain-containing protein [Rhizobium oryzihabitans]|uniref:Helix-turn-helix domain-containing protein n=1 Tax=Rhizobium oryzihabitans TaxID=2267833 RepID=A0A7L5BQB5_9HYPH|nr:helix-turn-helix domain-containing protein [Agrobacterium tumefaciens]QIB40963.1 helix-turn-helix domain-containing protein [Rhizobium oryzihabitans]CUX47190.1 AraC family transcriptional regulator [Agrobacterium genomosp. 5 str. CFBP 6626]
MRVVASEGLYGEEALQGTDFRFHCETLFSRSSLHRFEIGLHRHSAFLQILYIWGGEGDALLDGRIEAIRPPVAIVVPPDFEHGFRFSRDIGGVIVTVLPGALPASVQALLLRNFQQPVLLPLQGFTDGDRLRSGFEHISGEYEAREIGRDAMIEGQLASVVTLLARVMRPLMASSGEGLAERRFELLLSLIARHIREPRKAEFYAQKLGLSETHLNRLVRSVCGLSLQRLVARRQIEIAQQELIFTVSTVQMIAEGLGFADPAYFNRFFKRETGMTPRAWRLAEQRKMGDSGMRQMLPQTSILPSSR